VHFNMRREQGLWRVVGGLLAGGGGEDLGGIVYDIV
jgi:hypothetical protein